MQTIINFINDGGTVMYVILFVFFVGLSILIERTIYLLRSKLNTQEFMKELFSHIQSDKLPEAKSLCESYNAPLSKIMAAGISSFGSNKEDMKESVDEVAVSEIPKLLKRTHYLPLIANVSTLLGLLGTIFGLMQSFISVAGVDPALKAELLAKGISIAMNTTALGLMAAIPCLLGHSYLTTATQDIIHDIDICVTRLINYSKRIGGNSL